MQKSIKLKFHSLIKKVCNENEIVIITHTSDDFGNKTEVDNIVSFEEAMTILKQLQQTLSNYIGQDEHKKD